MLSAAVSAYTSVFFQMQNIRFPFMMKLLKLFMRKSVLHVFFSAYSYAVNTF